MQRYDYLKRKEGKNANTRSIICVALFGLLAAEGGQISYGQEQKDRAQVALEAADKNGDWKVTKDKFRGPERVFGIFDIIKNGYPDLADFEAVLLPPKDIVAKVGPNVDDKTLSQSGISCRQSRALYLDIPILSCLMRAQRVRSA